MTRNESTPFPGPVGMGDTKDEVLARVAAQVTMLVLEMQPGQEVVVQRFDDDQEMFRVQRRRFDA
ncbi:MAG TPA: hypothetical protein VEA41_09280 [Salinarimonas sp.]|nr:hypothetical protein [Salinarimonas sp.]